MAEAITFRGTTIFAGNELGCGWEFTPGSAPFEQAIESAPLGTGYWLKGGRRGTAEHSLRVVWLKVNGNLAIYNVIQGLIDGVAGDLVIPGWGTFGNCMLTGTDAWSAKASSEGEGYYIIETTLNFTQYPNGVNGVSC